MVIIKDFAAGNLKSDDEAELNVCFIKIHEVGVDCGVRHTFTLSQRNAKGKKLLRLFSCVDMFHLIL